MSDTEFERLIAALIHAAKFGEPVGKDSRGDLRAHVRALEERIAAQDDQINALQQQRSPAPYVEYRRADGCQASMDGECGWPECPQLRDGEPERSGRHCPRDAAIGESDE